MSDEINKYVEYFTEQAKHATLFRNLNEKGNASFKPNNGTENAKPNDAARQNASPNAAFNRKPAPQPVQQKPVTSTSSGSSSQSSSSPTPTAPKPVAPKPAPAPAKTVSKFGQAFQDARKSGKTEFEWNGKKYNSRMAGETDAQWKAKMSKTGSSTSSAPPVPHDRPNRTATKPGSSTSSAPPIPHDRPNRTATKPGTTIGDHETNAAAAKKPATVAQPDTGSKLQAFAANKPTTTAQPDTGSKLQAFAASQKQIPGSAADKPKATASSSTPSEVGIGADRLASRLAAAAPKPMGAVPNAQSGQPQNSSLPAPAAADTRAVQAASGYKGPDYSSMGAPYGNQGNLSYPPRRKWFGINNK